MRPRLNWKSRKWYTKVVLIAGGVVVAYTAFAIAMGIIVSLADIGEPENGQLTPATTQESIPTTTQESVPNPHKKRPSTTEADQVAPARPESRLTGFGATDAAWNAHHREDRRFAPGAAYDPDPSLARGGDQRYNARYYGVLHDGRVRNYEMRFPPGTGIQEAKRSVLASEFPSDAKIAWFKRRDSCAQMLVRSKKVAKELGADVVALVEFSSGEAGDRYDPGDVWSAIVLSTVWAGLGSGLGC